MAIKLVKLNFFGIRSFDLAPDTNFHEISFDKPLTILGGCNGAGKTTIIEILKLALTGEYPSSVEKLSSFLSANDDDDQRVAEIHLHLTKGQQHIIIEWDITLRPNNVSKRQMTCCIKQDGQLIWADLNQKEANTKISEILGFTSSSFFANLITVPEENSQWPLESTSNELKDIFDNLFNLEEHNKRLEGLVQERKELEKEIDELAPKFKTTREKLDTFKEKSKQIREIQTDIAKITAKQSKIDKENFPIEQQIKLYRKLDDIFDVRQSISENFQLVGISHDEIDELVQQPSSLVEKMDELQCQIIQKEKHYKKNTKNKEMLESYIRNENITLETILKALGGIIETEKLSQKYSQKLSLNFEKHSIPLRKGDLEQLMNSTNEEKLEVCRQIQQLRDKKTKLKVTKQNNEKLVQQRRKDILNLERQLAKAKQLESKWEAVETYVAELALKKTKLNNWKGHLEIEGTIMESFQELQIQVDTYREKLYKSQGQIETIDDFLRDLQRSSCGQCSTPLLNLNIDGTELGSKYQLQRALLDNTVKQMQNLIGKSVKKLTRLRDLIGTESIIMDTTVLVQTVDLNTPQCLVRPPLKRLKLSKSDTIVSNSNLYVHDIAQQLQTAKSELTRLNVQITETEANYLKINRIIQKREKLLNRLERKSKQQNQQLDIMTTLEQIQSLNNGGITMEEMEQQENECRLHISDWTRQMDALNVSALQKQIEDLKSRQTNLENVLPLVGKLKAVRIGALEVNKEIVNLGLPGFKFINQDELKSHLQNLERELARGKFTWQKYSAEQVAHASAKNLLEAEIKSAFKNVMANYNNVKKALLHKTLLIKRVKKDEKSARLLLVQTHKEKLSHINKYLANAWSALYYNDAIGSVRMVANIKSETDKMIKYDYFFVMDMAGGHAGLKMKGRVSSGEKYLASLIVRCALIDKFAALTCPILILDEPTSHLDSTVLDNFKHYVCQKLDCLQIIVTTHSRQFEQHLINTCDEDQYRVFKITKDSGNSIVQLHNDEA